MDIALRNWRPYNESTTKQNICFFVIYHEEVRKMQIIIKDLVSLTPTKTLLSDHASLTSYNLSKTSGPGIRTAKNK